MIVRIPGCGTAPPVAPVAPFGLRCDVVLVGVVAGPVGRWCGGFVRGDADGFFIDNGVAGREGAVRGGCRGS